MRRYQYDQITDTEPSVTRYKLYKAKKQWVVQGMTTVALLLGVHEAQVHGVPGLMAPDITTAHADTLNDQAQPTNDSAVTATQNVQQDDQNNDQENSTQTAMVATKTVVNTQDESETDQATVDNAANETTTATTSATQAVKASTGSTAPATSVNTESTNNEVATSQSPSKNNVTAVKATVQKIATPKVKSATDFNKQAAKITAQAQKVADNVNAVVKADAQQANAKSDDTVVHDSGLDAIQAHVNSELKQVKATTSMKLPKKLAQMQTTLNQANELLQSMRTELDVANKMLLEDKNGVNTQQVSDSEQALNKIVLPADTTAKIDEYGDLVVSTNNHASYQSVLNQMDSKGLTKAFRNVVDPVQLYYGTKGYNDAELLAAAKSAIKTRLGSLDITQDGSTIKTEPFYEAPTITYYNSLLPYWEKLQTEYTSGSAADLMLAAAEYFGAVQALGNITSGNLRTNSDQQQSTDNTSFALIINVDEYNNPIFTENVGPRIKAGDLLNNAGLVVDPTNPETDNGASVNNLVSPSGNSDTTYYVGKVGTEIANPTIKSSVPNFTYVSTEGPTKLSSILGGKTMQLVINHWKSAATPAVTALKAQVGDVTKVGDGTTTFKDVPTVTLSGEAGVKTPTFTADDFDWSQVKATPGSYSITLNASGIAKITALNANTTLATADITAGHATITAKTPTTVAIKAQVGDVTKVEDGTTTFKDEPTVTLSGEAGLKTPTFTADDFDWSQVKATPGSYSITLNATGIAKITALNANTTLATADVTAGHATITAKTPTTVAIKAKVGDVTKLEDGTTTFKDVPTVTLSGETGLKNPTFTVDDFDWSQVKATPGTYSITLNAKGIAKITALNANTTLATTDITVGHATITAKTPTTVAIKAQVGNVTKPYDGTTSFKAVPTVTLSGKSVLATPTFTAADFDWSQVKPDAGQYTVTLNAAGIKKITDANDGTTLATNDVTSGTVTINKAAITITPDNASKVQGQADPKLTATVTKPAAGADVKYTVSRAAGEEPGQYAITVTASATDNPNYTITANKRTFTIVAPNSVLATVGNVTKTYDGTTDFNGADNSVPKVTLTGGTDVVTPTFDHSDFDWSQVNANAGSYSVTLNAAGLKKITDANKGVQATAQAGHAIINKAAITITANDASKTAGQADPTFTATVSGLPTAGVKPVYTVSRVAGETPGTYAINVTATDAANPNYTITVKAGQFTIVANDFSWQAVYVDEAGKQLADPVSGEHLKAGDSYTTIAKYIDGYYLTAMPTNATGKIGDANVTIKYVYNKVGSYAIVSPSGQVTSVTYVVDHTDPTKVSAPTNQVVPYISGYYAVGPNGNLGLVDSTNPSRGYVLPTITNPGAISSIHYVAVNGGGGNGGNGGGSVTPSNNANNNNNAGSTTNNGATVSGNNDQNQTTNRNDQKTKPTTTKKKTAKKSAKKATKKAKTTKKATRNNQSGASRQAAKVNGNQTRGTRDRVARYTTNGTGVTKLSSTVGGNGQTGQNHKLPENQQVEKAATLPQTGDSNSPIAALIGVALAGLLGLFGIKKRKEI